ncbi:MAG: ABC transporter substrate-binding protein [Clostridia bacterium]|nr:ABC transporter substrate-binding protein [Clostridia bacterium]
MNKIIFKRISILFITAILCFSVSGCRRKENKQEIYFLNFKPEIAEAYDKIAIEYEKLTGVKVKVSTAAANTYEQTLKSEIAKKDAPTIFQINGPIGYESWKNYCADLKDTQLYSILSDKSLAVMGKDGGVYGIPYAIEGYGIICNTEKFDEYFALDDRQDDVNSFDEIDSFEDLKTVVEDMTRHKAQLSIEGVFASTSLLSGEDWRWQTHLANIPFHLEATENDYNIGEGVEEFKFTHNQYMKNLFDLYISNSVTEKTLLGSKSVADSMAEFALGRCAMVQNGNWAWSQIKNVPSNQVSEESIRFLPLYTGSPMDEDLGLCIGTENYFCINANASDEKKKLADDFLYWLFSSETGKGFVANELDFITPFRTFTEKQTPNDPLAREINRWLKKENVESVPWSFVAFPSTDFKNDFGSALLSYAQEKTSWDDVVRTVTERWKEEAKRGR